MKTENKNPTTKVSDSSDEEKKVTKRKKPRKKLNRINNVVAEKKVDENSDDSSGDDMVGAGMVALKLKEIKQKPVKQQQQQQKNKARKRKSAENDENEQPKVKRATNEYKKKEQCNKGAVHFTSSDEDEEETTSAGNESFNRAPTPPPEEILYSTKKRQTKAMKEARKQQAEVTVQAMSLLQSIDTPTTSSNVHPKKPKKEKSEDYVSFLLKIPQQQAAKVKFLRNSYIFEIKDIIKIDKEINYDFDLKCEDTVLSNGENLADLIGLIKFKEVRLVKIQLNDKSLLDETLNDEDDFYLKFAKDEKNSVEVNCKPTDTLREVTAKLNFPWQHGKLMFDGDELTNFDATVASLDLESGDCVQIKYATAKPT